MSLCGDVGKGLSGSEGRISGEWQLTHISAVPQGVSFSGNGVCL
jgi:hypothetical protein